MLESKVLWNRLKQDKKNKKTCYIRLESSKIRHFFITKLLHFFFFADSLAVEEVLLRDKNIDLYFL